MFLTSLRGLPGASSGCRRPISVAGASIQFLVVSDMELASISWRVSSQSTSGLRPILETQVARAGLGVVRDTFGRSPLSDSPGELARMCTVQFRRATTRVQIQVRTRHSKAHRERHLRTYVDRDAFLAVAESPIGAATAAPIKDPFQELRHTDGLGGVWGEMADTSG
ncbi:hypothetical protein Purlil1_13857 [Purpureocillium lilacinum]|uniref:Uncharacterized protein n=1 Tax=Purpureocillium lilacinum TaxID=33203 RepID=A0ABR0BCY5_PURLI|nr:hypothetical protein Purlil1_13857 [Purpureocillium lilacinum]